MSIYLSLVCSSFLFSLLELFTELKEKKIFKIFQNIFVLIIFSLFVLNRENNDYKGYLAFFNGEDIGIKEKGYLYLNQIIKYLGGNYHIVLLILGILMIFVFFYLYKVENKISFIFLYSIYTFVYDINQIRNFFCILFVLIGIKFLIDKKDYLYLFFNCLGILFQRIGLIYIIFYILQKFKLKNYIKLIIIFFIGGFVFIPFFKVGMLHFFPDKADYYFSLKPRFGMLLYWMFVFMDILMLKFLHKKDLSEKDELFIKFICFPIIFLPYSILNIEMIHRVWRNTLYIKWFYLLEPSEEKKEKLILFIILILQQIMFIGADLLKNLVGVKELISQVGNIGFYF